MTSVYFVDTSFWVALLSKADADHARAAAWHRYITATSGKLLTTHAVMWEMANSLSQRAARKQAAVVYRRSFHEPGMEVLDFSPEWNEAAISRYESRPDKDWSLTDCLSFVVMEQRAVYRALTADHHFQQAGFEALLLRDPPVP